MTFHTHGLTGGLILILLTAFPALKENVTCGFPCFLVDLISSWTLTDNPQLRLSSKVVIHSVLRSIFFFSRLIKKINKLSPPSLLSRSSVSALKTLGLHCPALCNTLSNQILYVNWTIAANRFRSEWKGFSPWILISNPQAESRNIKFPKLSSACKGEKTIYIYFLTIFKRIHA